MTRLTIYQPQYLPRLHYYARVLDSDIYGSADYLQYVRTHAYPSSNGVSRNGFSYQAHTPIKTNTETLHLGIPIVRRNFLPLNESAVNYATRWYQKHLKSIEWNYKKARNFSVLFPEITVLLSKEYQSLAELDHATLLWGLAVLFEIPYDHSHNNVQNQILSAAAATNFRLKEIVLLSNTNIPPSDKRAGYDADDWIIRACHTFGATEYCMGGTAVSAYSDIDRYGDAGIRPVQQNWHCTPYTQQFERTEFTPNLSIIDLLMNVSPAEAREILRTNID